ncbi:MAG TPA: cupredoxin domain-containing protein [Azospirillum sp.]|nr:cupredoxin domain-containing protein [Azospirillum sp.]
MRRLLAALLVAAPLGVAGSALAADGEFTVVIKDHKFQPATLEVPAGQKLVLIVENQDATAEEFESTDFKAEKIIGGGRTARVNVAPLKPGTYKFFGEFNMETAQGTLIAK